MRELRRLLQPHEPDQLCHPDHCYICHIDEPGEGYIRCFECKHLYKTKRDLRKAYRRELIGGMKFSRKFGIKTPFWRSTSFSPSRVRVWWMLLTVRASKITFCQHCVHDF